MAKTYVFEFKTKSGIVRNSRVSFHLALKPTADEIAIQLLHMAYMRYYIIEPLKVWSYGE